MSKESIVKRNLSLLDTAYREPVDVWLVFTEYDTEKLDRPRTRLWNMLEPGFRHVEVWKQLGPKVWLQLGTGVEHIKIEWHTVPPWLALPERFKATAVRVQRQVVVGPWRCKFFVGPITCVELTKAFLGIGNFFIRTPYQLYRFLRTRDI